MNQGRYNTHFGQNTVLNILIQIKFLKHRSSLKGGMRKIFCRNIFF